MGTSMDRAKIDVLPSSVVKEEAVSGTYDVDRLQHRMAPSITEAPLFPSEIEPKLSKVSNNQTLKSDDNTKEYQYKIEIVWRNVISMLYLHIAALYGLYLAFFVCKWSTFIYTIIAVTIILVGITGGAHRLWAHRSYKANLPLRIILMILQTMAYQNHIYEWARDHRVHHKYTETNADPHNASRGFFFSHVGWLLVKKHKDVIIKGKTIDLSDLEADPVVRFQRKYYLYMLPILCFLLPAWIPYYFFGEDPWTSFYVAGIMRYVLSVNITWCVNSAAHLWGCKPYDKNIGPCDNLFVCSIALGEGFHNYHHVFPWDYKAAELGNYGLNFTLLVINFFAKIGWATDLKTVSREMIEKRIKRTGDGSKVVENKCNNNNDTDDHHNGIVWGWGDTDMQEEDIKDIKLYNKLSAD